MLTRCYKGHRTWTHNLLCINIFQKSLSTKQLCSWVASFAYWIIWENCYMWGGFLLLVSNLTILDLTFVIEELQKINRDTLILSRWGRERWDGVPKLRQKQGTGTKAGGVQREQNTNCNVALANNSLHTSSAYIARFSSMFLHFGNIVDWRASLHAWSN
jgi:hypothetical protein